AAGRPATRTAGSPGARATGAGTSRTRTTRTARTRAGRRTARPSTRGAESRARGSWRRRRDLAGDRGRVIDVGDETRRRIFHARVVRPVKLPEILQAHGFL